MRCALPVFLTRTALATFERIWLLISQSFQPSVPRNVKCGCSSGVASAECTKRLWVFSGVARQVVRERRRWRHRYVTQHLMERLLSGKRRRLLLAGKPVRRQNWHRFYSTISIFQTVLVRPGWGANLGHVTECVTLYCTWRPSSLTTRPHGQVLPHGRTPYISCGSLNKLVDIMGSMVAVHGRGLYSSRRCYNCTLRLINHVCCTCFKDYRNKWLHDLN